MEHPYMLETLLHAVLRLFAFLLHGLLEWWSWGGETETEQWFFYCTACVAVPILSFGLLRVERYSNSQLLDWRTISTDSAEVVGQMLWWIAALLLLAGIWSYLDGKT